MGLVSLFLFFSITISCTYSAGSKATILELAKQSEDDLAPFKKTSLDRLHGEVFGSGRAARSTDVALFNKSDYKFKLVGQNCETGGFTGTLLPEDEIPAHSSIVYGAESHGFLTGVTECVVQYKSSDGSAYFEINFSNPFVGPVLGCGVGTKVAVRTIVATGNNNIMRVTIDKGNDDSSKNAKRTKGFLRCK